VSSIELENLISASKNAGAFGAKLSGAGGGDCMLALSDETNEKSIAREIKKAGGKIIEVEMNAEGVRREQ
jgi:mevalonate kinase